ncbi:hypothetical protein [Streptomyces africanus]|uniref:hypothetical protein n=1 Tax=Streptomyces africanus TaxID=231024 RepID=UPI000A3875EB|nr:hypothetical protein [Streptomyces africanus]
MTYTLTRTLPDGTVKTSPTAMGTLPDGTVKTSPTAMGTLPDGTVKTSPTAMGTLRAVEIAIAYCLMDNSNVPRGEARRFAADVVSRPIGAEVEHESSGYAFRVERAR